MAKSFLQASEMRCKFLSLCLLDALEDEDVSTIHTLLEKYKANPNVIPINGGISPMHYVSGMENIQLAENTLRTFLHCGGNPNVTTEDNVTPVHVAAMNGRTSIIKILLNAGGNIQMHDIENKTPIDYAIEENHSEVVDIIKNHIFEKKLQKKARECTENSNMSTTSTPRSSPVNYNVLTLKNSETQKYTPNRINYNYDITSPYYINITHRRKPRTTETVPLDHESSKENRQNNLALETGVYNLFSLQKQEIENIAREHQNDNRSEKWRRRVNRSIGRKSIIKECGDIDSVMNKLNNKEIDFNDYIAAIDIPPESASGNIDAGKEEPSVSIKGGTPNIVVPNIIVTEVTSVDPIETSFQTAPEMLDEYVNRRSPPIENDWLIAKYIHSDNEYDINFYEMKLLKTSQIALNSQQPLTPNSSRGSQESDKVTSQGSHSPAKSSEANLVLLATDYDTDLLRENLTAFGEAPGPITKTTKKLYAKRLARYQLNASKTLAEREANKALELNYSVELNRTVRKIEWFERIPEFYGLVSECSTYFINNNKKMREGNIKQSFIYLLIDPRISQNLPIESSQMHKFDVWKRFLQSIFYVGKGKSARPYSHLYNAIKKYSTISEEDDTAKSKLCSLSVKNSEENKKLKRIIQIWNANYGVVCLHVFHSISPVEAYTREAAMIEALGLLHLTNVKSGDYYGASKTWPMRTKKHMGIALLFKAMKMYLVEGESQISPCDL